MAATSSPPFDLSPDLVTANSQMLPPAIGSRSPRHKRSPSQNTMDSHSRRQQRHSKKLSLSFPILVSTREADTPSSCHTASPTALSAHPMANSVYFAPSPIHTSHAAVPSSMSLHMPLTPPSEEEHVHILSRARSKSKSHTRQESTSTEFLTLLASQERRVLELKEELIRAENELTSLKKQWAIYEAGKKKNEIKGTPVPMRPVATSHKRAASVVETGTGLGLSGIDEPVCEDKLEAEREKLRELARERMMGRLTYPENGQTALGNVKKTGQRVFQNSRHTRTLSLLTSTTGTRSERTGSLDSAATSKTSLDSARQPSIDTPPTNTTVSTPILSRTNSALDGLNFGKTYKDLANAASRKNLPQGLSPEQLVKQSKQMVDGVRDGLWNFFEDIRQATVGEEAITGANNGVRRQNSAKHHPNTGHSKLKRTMADASNTSKQKENETSFWREFGIDTPKGDKTKRNSVGNEKRPSLPGRWPSTKVGEDLQHTCAKHGHDHEEEARKMTTVKASHKKDSAEHHESKSSTDSRSPPSLLHDLLDDEDDGWDNWDSNTDPGSPQSARKRAAKKDVCIARTGDGKEVQWHDLLS